MNSGARFDPDHLTAAASLNRLRIDALPGVPRTLVGLTGFDLLSRDAVLTVFEGHGIHAPGVAAADAVGAALSGGDAARRSCAGRAIDELGCRLGCLLATLLDPATAGRQGDTPERQRYLAHWSGGVRVVWLAGGLAAGGAGVALTRVTQRTLERVVGEGPEVRLPRDPQLLPLLGAARTASTSDGTVVVLDCGQTSIKRAVITVRHGTLTDMAVLSAWPQATTTEANRPPATAMTEALLATMQVARHFRAGPLHSVVPVSVASYVHAGRPMQDGRGIYDGLAQVTPEVEAKVGRELGQLVTLDYVHDGTAAWRAVADGPSAIVVLGSALGVGVGPQATPRRPLAPGFRVAMGMPERGPAAGH